MSRRFFCLFVFDNSVFLGLGTRDVHVSAEGKQVNIERYIYTYEYHSAVSTVANDHETGEEIAIVVRTDESTGNTPITFWRAWFLPGVFMVTQENFPIC